MSKFPFWAKTIYLYLFSLVGLVLIIIGTVNFLDMGLKAYVFTQADKDQQVNYLRPPVPHSSQIENIKELKSNEELSEEQMQSIEQWLEDYKEWQKRREEVDPVTSRRHEQAAKNLALILVGLPVFLYHWRIVRKENE